MHHHLDPARGAHCHLLGAEVSLGLAHAGIGHRAGDGAERDLEGREGAHVRILTSCLLLRRELPFDRREHARRGEGGVEVRWQLARGDAVREGIVALHDGICDHIVKLPHERPKVLVAGTTEPSARPPRQVAKGLSEVDARRWRDGDRQHARDRARADWVLGAELRQDPLGDVGKARGVEKVARASELAIVDQSQDLGQPPLAVLVCLRVMRAPRAVSLLACEPPPLVRGESSLAIAPPPLDEGRAVATPPRLEALC